VSLLALILNLTVEHSSGAEAIENAVKLARHATKKPNIIVFSGSFHGRTLGTKQNISFDLDLNWKLTLF
jgi:4-aminobutyrate aminotransferase-like enzyme